MTAPCRLLLAAAATVAASVLVPPAPDASPPAAARGGEQAAAIGTALVLYADPPRPRPRRIPRATRSRVRTSTRAVRPRRQVAAVPPPGQGHEGTALGAGGGFTAWADSRATYLVFRCESHWNPRAVSASGKYRGLAQMDAHFWASYGGLTYAPRADLATRDQQLHVAYRGWQARGWSPWTCSRIVGVA